MNIKTCNTILYCQNWKETVVFYRDVLQLKVLFSNEWFVELAISDTARLSVADERRASIKSSHGKGITLAFEVEDIEKSFHYLEKMGTKSSPVRDHPWGAKVFYLYDPEGNRLEFWESVR